MTSFSKLFYLSVGIDGKVVDDEYHGGGRRVGQVLQRPRIAGAEDHEGLLLHHAGNVVEDGPDDGLQHADAALAVLLLDSGEDGLEEVPQVAVVLHAGLVAAQHLKELWKTFLMKGFSVS